MDPIEKIAATERLKKLLIERRGYYSPANLSAAAESERLDKFVNGQPSPVTENPEKSPFDK